MYAVFRSGGKQYRATKGDRLRLEKLDADEGATVEFDEVLLVGEGADIKVGSPYLDGGSVTAKVVEQGKSRKVNVVKFKRRQNYLKQGTHRQFFTDVEITEISAAGGKPRAKAAEDKPADGTKVAKKKSTKKKAAKKAAGKKTASGKKVSKKKTTRKKTGKKKTSKKKTN